MSKGLSIFQAALIAALLLHLLLLLTVQTGRRPLLPEVAATRIAIRLRPAAATFPPVAVPTPAVLRPVVENDNQKQNISRPVPAATPAPIVAAPQPVAALPATEAAPSIPPAAAPAEVVAAAVPAAEPVEKTAPAPVAARAVAKESAASQLAPYLATVRTQIEQHKDYPAFARQLHQQGTVTVRVTIAPDGRLRSVVILASSGHASLDKAALAAVRNAGRFAAPKNFALDDVAVDIPMTYKLI